MATRYVWRKQDITYGQTTGGYGSVYVGGQTIYGASDYSFDTGTGLYKLTNPTAISVSQLENKSRYRYFMVGGTSGTTVYDNTSHSLPEDEVKTSTTYDYGPTSSSYLVAKVTEDGVTKTKPLRDSNGKLVVVDKISSSGQRADDAGRVSVGDLDSGTFRRDYDFGDQSVSAGSNATSIKVDGVTYSYVQQYSYSSSSSSYTVSYYYLISGGYICVDSTSSDRSSDRSSSRSSQIQSRAWWNDNLIEYGQNNWTSSTSRYEDKASFRSIGINVQPTGVGEYISSRNSGEYPQKGVQGGKYYTFTIADEPDPLGILVSDDDGKLRPEVEEVTITISESKIQTLKTYGTVQYIYYYSIDTGATWEEIETTDQTSIQFTIPRYSDEEEEVENTTLMVGAKFKDNIGFVGDLVTSTNYALTLNMPPVISGVDEDWGTLTSYTDDKPNFVYQVWDEDTEEVETTDEEGNPIIEERPSDIVTVQEYIDDVMIASYSFKGITEHVFTFPDHNWLTLLNGEHTLRIVATDDKDDSTTRTYTFTKAIDEISVMFEEPMESLEAMYLAVEEMVAELPTGCQIWVYICNDGFDEHPSWQDATVEVRNGTKIYITNAGIWDGQEAEEMEPGYKWGYNIWVRIKRGTAEGPVYLTSIDGHWK